MLPDDIKNSNHQIVWIGKVSNDMNKATDTRNHPLTITARKPQDKHTTINNLGHKG